MKPVIDSMVVSNEFHYKFTKSLFHKVVLWVGIEMQDWDTNTGLNVGKSYIKWEKANLEQAKRLLKKIIRDGNTRY